MRTRGKAQLDGLLRQEPPIGAEVELVQLTVQNIVGQSLHRMFVTNDGVDRKELMVLLTPHVVRNGREADAATDELRAKLPLIRGIPISHGQ